MWNDPLARLFAALDDLDRARRHLTVADGVPWTGPIAPRYRTEVEALAHAVTTLRGGVGAHIAASGCRP